MFRPKSVLMSYHVYIVFVENIQICNVCNVYVFVGYVMAS